MHFSISLWRTSHDGLLSAAQRVTEAVNFKGSRAKAIAHARSLITGSAEYALVARSDVRTAYPKSTMVTPVAVIIPDPHDSVVREAKDAVDA